MRFFQLAALCTIAVGSTSTLAAPMPLHARSVSRGRSRLPSKLISSSKAVVAHPVYMKRDPAPALAAETAAAATDAAASDAAAATATAADATVRPNTFRPMRTSLTS
ncbi:uncharacterized protein SCHCODRAFT_02612322 [Schizophyllum commune H4-8]|uniref:uncharacterized protein n=1 Tax=Schizophyllum commune (strain H4-8 / FGSC 9210) TaxID=578458 RepID=UPI00215F1ABA|nr:uncharacterized protein SCHCODRAFT_02612322 [Schizophyllum commune H4-8]KAI5898517.1 hypothetical protein SCHCODRAFT_02612322 [Schizophyllum commune H4-8]